MTTTFNYGLATAMAGELVTGICLTLCTQTLFQYGLDVGISNDKKRQIVLNLLCLTASVVAVFGYPFNFTLESVNVSDAVATIIFVTVQYGLVILNHNTIVRASNLVGTLHYDRKKINRWCYILYLLPILVLIPMYLSFKEMYPLKKLMILSSYNSLYYKPLNIALIIATECLAFITDLLLLNKARKTRKSTGLSSGRSFQKAKSSSEAGQTQFSEIFGLSSDLLASYGITWMFFLADIILKGLISNGYRLLFDSIVTVATIALRSRANLQYGLELQAIFKPAPSRGTDNSLITKEASSGNPHQNIPMQSAPYSSHASA